MYFRDSLKTKGLLLAVGIAVVVAICVMYAASARKVQHVDMATDPVSVQSMGFAL